MLWEPTENVHALVGVALQDNKTHSGQGAGQLCVADPLQVQCSRRDPDAVVYPLTSAIGSGENKFRQYWAHVDWNLGAATLTYVPSIRRWEQNALVVQTGAVSFQQVAQTPYDQFHTEELRLASNGDSALKWQTGAFYYDNNLNSYNEVWNGVNASGGRTGGFIEDIKKKDTTNIGVFAESTYSFTKALRLTAGLRYDQTKVQIEEDYTDRTAPNAPPAFVQLRGDAGKKTFNNLTYKLRLEGNLTDANLLYGSLSTGVLPGDIQVISPRINVLEVTTLKAETLTSLELGSKNRFLDERLQVNGDVFYYRYGAFQRPGTLVSVIPCCTFASLTSGARMWGAEIEAMYRPTQADRFSGSVGYVHARYVDKDPLFASIVLQDSVNNMTPLTGQLSYGHDFKLPAEQQLSINVDANFRGPTTWSDERAIARGANSLQLNYVSWLKTGTQVVANVSATWTLRPKLSLTGYVRNVADNRYKNSVAIVQDPNTKAPGSAIPAGGLSDPRTYGVVVNVGF
jgi:iron complex outermembrane receptor protein